MKLLSISLTLLLAFTLTSCFQTDNDRVVDFLPTPNTPFGAFPKLIAVESDAFDFNDLENSSYSHSVDFIDGAGGLQVSEYRIFVSYQQLDSIESLPVLLRNVQSRSFFLRPETNQIGLDLTISFAEVADALGIDDFSAFSTEDRFNFSTELVKSDGRLFSSLNSRPAITNSLGGIWDFRVKAECQSAEDMFVGEYQISYGYLYDLVPALGGGRPFGNTLDRAVFLSLTDDPSVRRFNYGPYLTPWSFLSQDVSLRFSCGNLQQSDLRTTSNGCGSEPFGAIQNGVATYDPNDDSTFTIEMIDLPPELDGDCFFPTFGSSLKYSIVFSKN
jgi:hypothetical protein